MIIDGDRESASDQSWQQLGEPEQFVESAFEGGHLLGKIDAESVPEGLVLDAGVEPLDGVGERLGARRGPDENAPQHAGAASGSVAKLEDVETMSDGLGKNEVAGDGSWRWVVDFHRTQAPSLEAIA